MADCQAVELHLAIVAPLNEDHLLTAAIHPAQRRVEPARTRWIAAARFFGLPGDLPRNFLGRRVITGDTSGRHQRRDHQGKNDRNGNESASAHRHSFPLKIDPVHRALLQRVAIKARTLAHPPQKRQPRNRCLLSCLSDAEAPMDSASGERGQLFSSRRFRHGLLGRLRNS